MDTAKDSQKTTRHNVRSRASETCQRARHICDEAQRTHQRAQILPQECHEIIDRIFLARLLPVLALVTSYVVEVS